MRGKSNTTSFVVRGKRINATAAISTIGLITYEFYQSSVNLDHFCDFIRGKVIPNMLPFDGLNDRSILVMDNASIHCTNSVVHILNNAGILVLHLPPYSPDYNPTEEAFSYVKYYLKEHEEFLQAVPSPMTLLSAAFESITTDNGVIYFYYYHYYYYQ
uniref:Tc1-like transposase DDE domain-containing protein n=1 Tax=Amphimedon queenslandica TaxID=400682 RepID=A0A1X7V151_AMPQE